MVSHAEDKVIKRIRDLAKDGFFDIELYENLVNDQGGFDHIATARKTICRIAAGRHLMWQGCMAWIAKHGPFLRDRRRIKNPKIHPIVNLARQLGSDLREDLRAIGLDKVKVEKKIQTIEDIKAEVEP
jgi:hypothetical protein